jgi:hypothetical protein
MQQRGQNASSGTAQGVAQDNSSPVDIDDLRIHAQLLHHRQRLHGKSFVKFDQADLVEGQPGTPQGSLCSGDGV